MKQKHFTRLLRIAVYLISVPALAFLSFAVARETTITNGIIKARLYLPDADSGYYRASRFDWAGVISSLECDGHTYYGQWFSQQNPLKDDAITGPAESFDPLGYEQAKTGGTFVKIGVGALVKPNQSPYYFGKLYPIVNHGQWQVKTATNQVQFTQTLNDSAYAYTYQKTVKLIKGKPVMVLEHRLKNTGTQTIETSVFDHNFFLIDKQLTGPGIVITLPAMPTDTVTDVNKNFIKIRGNQLLFLRPLEQKQISFKDLTDGRGASPYDIRVENHQTGAGVRITADRPMARLVFWSMNTTFCPEPYINIKIKPGEEFKWNITYEYYNCTINKSIPVAAN